LLNGAYVRNRSSNELLAYSLPSITGFSNINENFPAVVQNAEWELSLNTINIKSMDFSLSTHINLTVPRNKLLSFPNLATSSYSYSLIVGKPLQIAEAFHFLGVNDST